MEGTGASASEEGPPFFIVGSARSGTTLLRLILNAHPRVTVPPESRFITELWDGRDEVFVEDLLASLAANERFQMWRIPIAAVREELGPAQRAPYAEVMAAAYQAYAHSQGKTRWGDKTPRYIEHIPLLARMWPRARFVHLVRDGRNVALSYADVPFGPKTVAAAAALWATRVMAGIRAGRSLGPGRYLEIRYEDLVEDPQRELKSICDFLGLQYDPAMLDYTATAPHDALPRATHYNPRLMQPLLRHVRSWERHMPDRQVEVFEAVAGDVLSQLGYPRRHPNPGPAARLQASLARMGVPLGRLKGENKSDARGARP
jgi:hypothetical protein